MAGMVDRKDANLKMLSEANEVQQKTKEALVRIQQQASEAEDLGTQTLEELRRQGQQIDDISAEIDAVSGKLDQSAALQTKFDAWAGNWVGWKKSKALKEAANEINERSKEEHSKVKEVFQHEKYDSITRTWKKAGLVLCFNTQVAADDIFDPYIQESLGQASSWKVDFSLAGIDAEGWTYAYDFAALNKNGAGDKEPKWNSYVRRRKWKFHEKSSVLTGGGIDEVRDRANARTLKPAANTGSRQTEKLGYVPRNKQAASLAPSGLSSAGMMGKSKNPDPSQDLDSESQAGLDKIRQEDAEIDESLDAISRTIDNLSNISKTMREETLDQNRKLDKMDDKMEVAAGKQTVVNARLRHILK
eukprot:gene5192-7226_t